jgi:phospholipid-binding lipoprotein MlaA
MHPPHCRPVADLPDDLVRISASPRRPVICAGLAVLLTTFLLCGCATPPTDPAQRVTFEQNNDPFEPLNRRILDVNLFVDKFLLRPAAVAYVSTIPEDGRKAIHNVLDNMKEPTLVFNNVLQGELKRAEISLGRFLMNSTVGFGGMVDAATLSGVERQYADFGQTLYVWGVPSGPYIMLPLLGPSNPRDAIGGGVDSYADPWTIVAKHSDVTDLIMTRFIVGGIDERAEVLDQLDDLQKNALDYYAELRSLTQQHRASQLNRGAAAVPDTTPNFYTDPGKK